MRTNPLKFSGARRRMNVFRFCRQGLTALTVVFMFMACDQLLPTGGSGKLVAVKIRAISIAGGAQNETITRASGSNDLLYQTFTPTGTIPATGLDLSFTGLTHKLARVELVLDGNGKTITNVDNSKISLDAANTGSFNLKEGKFSAASGYRHSSAGLLYSVGHYGCYWSSSACGNSVACYLGFYYNNAGADDAGRSASCPVRCVLQE